MSRAPVDDGQELADPGLEGRRMVEDQLFSIHDARVKEAMAAVPRHLFVPKRLRRLAYRDTPLPIGFRQTISQPLMIAAMLELAELGGEERVLEIGTGSGYQAALLSRLAKEVYSVEIIPELAESARRNLASAQITDVHVCTANGSLGWPAAAPYDAIIVAAAAPEIPVPLVDQLADGGRLVIPVGSPPLQVLKRLRKSRIRNEVEDFDLCAFVPLVGAHGVRPDG